MWSYRVRDFANPVDGVGMSGKSNKVLTIEV